MEMNRKIKVVYVDNGKTKVLKGILVEEDLHTLSISINNPLNKKTVMLGKQALVKVTYIDEEVSEWVLRKKKMIKQMR